MLYKTITIHSCIKKFLKVSFNLQQHKTPNFKRQVLIVYLIIRFLLFLKLMQTQTKYIVNLQKCSKY